MILKNIQEKKIPKIVPVHSFQGDQKCPKSVGQVLTSNWLSRQLYWPSRKSEVSLSCPGETFVIPNEYASFSCFPLSFFFIFYSLSCFSFLRKLRARSRGVTIRPFPFLFPEVAFWKTCFPLFFPFFSRNENGNGDQRQ